MERVSLSAQKRECGKTISKRLRAEGKIPAILYGRKLEPLSISVDRRDVERITKTKSGMNVLIDLSVAGSDPGLAFIRDYQADPFRRDFSHIDFQSISLDEKIDVEIPVVLLGPSKGEKEGGIVEHLRRTILIRALPKSIPDKVEVDITEMVIGDSVHADEIRLPEGVEFPHTVNFSIVSIVPPAKEEVVAPPVEAAAVPAEGEAVAAAPAVTTGAAPAEGEAKETKGKEGKAKEGKAAKEEKAKGQ